MSFEGVELFCLCFLIDWSVIVWMLDIFVAVFLFAIIEDMVVKTGLGNFSSDLCLCAESRWIAFSGGQ